MQIYLVLLGMIVSTFFIFKLNDLIKCTCLKPKLLVFVLFLVKWSTTVLEVEKKLGLEKEQADGLFCPECLPSCSDTFYTITSMDLPLVATKRTYDSIL